MPKFISSNYDQDAMVVLNFKQQLQPGTFEYAIHYQFRQRDARFQHQKTKYGKRQQYLNQKSKPLEVPPSEFQLDEKAETCRCPKGHLMWLKNKSRDPYGNDKLFFEGRLTKCRDCPIKNQCMRNPRSADTRRGHGRQVSFIINKTKRPPSYTDWMKQRIDSDEGKHIYSHRLSVVEPVFANITTNKKLKRFSLRGKMKVQNQWQLYCLAHNIEKLANYGQLAA